MVIGILIGVAVIAAMIGGFLYYRRRKAAQVQVLERTMVNLSGMTELTTNPYSHADKA
jgi:hypothetical protein